MEGASKLEQLIEWSRSEGTLDSTGSFTVDWKHALEKIGALSLQYPARWVFFLAQAAVASRALGLNVSCARNLVSVEILLDQETFPLDQVLNQSGQRSPAATFVYSALLWSQALDPECVELLYQNSERGYLYRIQGGQETQQSMPANYHRLVLLYRPKVAEQEFKRLVALLSQQLSSALCYCPVPVFLDSRPLAKGEALNVIPKDISPVGYRVYRRLILARPEDPTVLACAAPLAWPAHKVLVEGHGTYRNPQPSDQLGILEIAGSFSQPPRPLQPGDLPLLPDLGLPLDNSPWIGSLVRCRAAFYRVRRPLGKLQIVHQGLSLEPIDIPELQDHGWGIIVASHTIRTDFSGLKVVEDEKYHQILDWARQTIAHTYPRLAQL